MGLAIILTEIPGQSEPGITRNWGHGYPCAIDHKPEWSCSGATDTDSHKGYQYQMRQGATKAQRKVSCYPKQVVLRSLVAMESAKNRHERWLMTPG